MNGTAWSFDARPHAPLTPRSILVNGLRAAPNRQRSDMLNLAGRRGLIVSRRAGGFLVGAQSHSLPLAHFLVAMNRLRSGWGFSADLNCESMASLIRGGPWGERLIRMIFGRGWLRRWPRDARGEQGSKKGNRHPAISKNVLAIDEVGVIGNQKGGELRDVFGP